MTLFLILACQATVPALVVSTVDTAPVEDPVSEDTGELVVDERLADRVVDARLLSHLEALAEIGENNGDTRYWTSEGHLDSTDYVVQQLTDAGYAPWLDLHTYTDRVVDSVGLALAEGDGWDYGDDFVVMPGSGSGDLRSHFSAVDLVIPPGDEANSSTSGCQSEDFVDFPAGDIALIQRGSCTFAEKVQNALDAGAIAVLIFNEGQPGRREPVSGTLGQSFDVPVFGLSYALGAELAQSTAELDLTVQFEIEELALSNVFAELPGDERVVLVGAHLDSVAAGPGLNDNGSGSVLVLELAIQLAQMEIEDRPTVRFAWWDGEEYGLLGSYAYVQEQASADALPNAYFNYDMVASPNGVPFVYDGDGSVGDGTAPRGSDVLEYALQAGYEVQGEESEQTGPWVPTDTYPFLEAGVASSGIFTGAYEGLGQSMADKYGGDVGDAMDACYHRLCDDLQNIDLERMTVASKAAAHALQEVLEDDSALGDRGGLEPPKLAPILPHDLPHCGSHGGSEGSERQ